MEYTLVRTAMALINSFPITISIWLARRVGEAMFLVMPGRRRIARGNLTIAFGNSKPDAEKRRLVVESFRHFVTSLVEFSRLPKFVKVSAQHVRFEGTEHLDRAFSRGKGLILVMSHLGPWEYLAFLAHLRKYPSTILGRAIRNPYLYQWVKSLRMTASLRHSDKALGLRETFSELRANHLVAIAIDQWGGNEGLWIDFFNIPTSTTSLPARLAKRTGCALIPAYCIRVANGEYEIHVQPEVSISENEINWIESVTKKLNSFLEEQIRLYPEQWMWTHNRWKKEGLRR